VFFYIMACGVELVEQTSRSLCIRNFSFGCLNRSTIWASDCRGRFRCAGGDAFACGTPPGSAQYFCDCGGARVDRFEFTTGSNWRDPAADLRRTSGGKARFKPLSSSEMAKCGVGPELLDEAKGLIDALRSGEGIDALLARHEEVMREFRLDAVYDHED